MCEHLQIVSPPGNQVYSWKPGSIVGNPQNVQISSSKLNRIPSTINTTKMLTFCIVVLTWNSMPDRPVQSPSQMPLVYQSERRSRPYKMSMGRALKLFHRVPRCTREIYGNNVGRVHRNTERERRWEFTVSQPPIRGSVN